MLVSAYREDIVSGEKRTYLSLHPSIAPIKVSVLPLLKNKPDIVAKAHELYMTLKKNGLNCDFDTSGAIGRRYRRADEIGTPFCVTIDFDTLSDNTVTVRSRDTMAQSRMQISEVLHFVRSQMVV